MQLHLINTFDKVSNGEMNLSDAEKSFEDIGNEIDEITNKFSATLTKIGELRAKIDEGFYGDHRINDLRDGCDNLVDEFVNIIDDFTNGNMDLPEDIFSNIESEIDKIIGDYDKKKEIIEDKNTSESKKEFWKKYVGKRMTDQLSLLSNKLHSLFVEKRIKQDVESLVKDHDNEREKDPLMFYPCDKEIKNKLINVNTSKIENYEIEDSEIEKLGNTVIYDSISNDMQQALLEFNTVVTAQIKKLYQAAEKYAKKSEEEENDYNADLYQEKSGAFIALAESIEQDRLEFVKDYVDEMHRL